MKITIKLRRTAVLVITVLLALSFLNVLTPEINALSYTEVPMNHSEIRYLGRWELSDGGTRARMYFESSLELNFTGSSVSVRVSDINGGFIYSIDQDAFTEVKDANGSVVLKSGMSGGAHTLKIYGRFENSRPQFSGFLLESNASVLPSSDSKTIEFIGDSISAGWIGGDGITGGMVYSHTLQTAEKLGLSCNTVAYGGIALASASADPLKMSERYFKTQQYKSGETADDWVEWDTSRYTPDYIVINLGSNDIVSSDDFKREYVSFLTELRRHYKDTVIFAVSPVCGKYRYEISEAVAERYRGGDKGVAFINTYGWIVGTDTTDGIHPNVAGQRRIAQMLANSISAYLSAPGGQSTGKSISVADNNIAYSGRCVISDDLTYVNLYFGSGLEIGFTGTSFTFNYKGRFIYSVDGGEYIDIKSVGPGLYGGISGLSPGTHTVKLYARYESERTCLSNFTIDANAKLLKKTERKKIEFIGDSITAGWVGGSSRQYGLHYSYSLNTGELLGFSHNTVAFGGIRLADDGGSDPIGMANRYFKTLNYAKGETEWPDWDTSLYTPDYIVINLGTNDRCNSEKFQNIYNGFLVKLRKSYPNAVIFAIAPVGGRYRKEIADVVSTRNSAGDSKVVYINTYGWIAGVDTSDSLHPTVEAQKKLAGLLADKISEYINSSDKGKADSENKNTSSSVISSVRNETGSSVTSDKTAVNNRVNISSESEQKPQQANVKTDLINNGKGWSIRKPILIAAIITAALAAAATASVLIIRCIKRLRLKKPAAVLGFRKKK